VLKAGSAKDFISLRLDSAKREMTKMPLTMKGKQSLGLL